MKGLPDNMFSTFKGILGQLETFCGDPTSGDFKPFGSPFEARFS